MDEPARDRPTTTLVSVPHLVHAHGVRADTAAGWDIATQHQQHTFLHADPADSTFNHDLVDNDITVPVHDRLVFPEGMAIADPENIGNVPASDELAAEVVEYRVSRAERHAAKVAFELRVTQLLDLMRAAPSEENRRKAYDQAVHTVNASVKLGLGHGVLPPYEEMTS